MGKDRRIGPGQLLDLEKLLRIPHVDPHTGFDVSPDGACVAFAWNRTGQWEIYEALLDLSRPPRQVTAGPGAKFAPRFAPDGQHLAYTLDDDGSEALDLYVCNRATGAHTCLTPRTSYALQPSLAWSSPLPERGGDGLHIAFLSDEAGHFDPWVLPATGGPARLLWNSSYPAWDVDWSPAGGWLAVVAETQGQDHGIFLVPLAGGEVRPIAGEGGALNARDARWSPDGAIVAFSSDRHGRFEIGLWHMATEQTEWLTAGSGDKEAPAWSADGRRLAYVAGQGPVNQVAILDLETGLSSRHQVEAGIHHRPCFTPDGRGVVVAFENPRHPPDLWLLSRLDGSWQQITHSLLPGCENASFAMPAAIHYRSTDGRRVPALLYRPVLATGPGSAVVMVHGGPNWLAQVAWDPAIQHMVARGWTVLAPNYRGSTGYGHEWQLANRYDLGGQDTEDVVAGADYLVAEGLAGRQRVAVTGRSYGGYLTMTALTRFPDRWAGGSAVVPFLNWFTSHANVREDVRHWDLENFGDPERDHALWQERSPFFFLDRVQAPVQMICGAHDVRCPAVESIQARDTLQILGREVELVLYGDEGHSFLRMENVVDAEQRRVAFLARVLECARD